MILKIISKPNVFMRAIRIRENREEVDALERIIKEALWYRNDFTNTQRMQILKNLVEDAKRRQEITLEKATRAHIEQETANDVARSINLFNLL